MAFYPSLFRRTSHSTLQASSSCSIAPSHSKSFSSVATPELSEPPGVIPDHSSLDMLIQPGATTPVDAIPLPPVQNVISCCDRPQPEQSNPKPSSRKPPPMPKPAPPARQTFSLRRVNSDTALLRPSSTPAASPRLQLLSLTRRAHREEYNGPAAARFASRVVSAVNDSAICLLISVGHQLGLFSVLSRLSARPHSVGTIAKSARELHPRYVQEWLSAMACVGIVEEFVVASGAPGCEVRKYRLPPEHATLLNWGSRAGNMALLAQYVPILGRLEDAIAGCFRTGTGLGASAFTHFDSVASLDALQTIGDGFETRMCDKVPGLLDELNDGACVLCIGGAGDAVYIQLAKRFPKSWFTCYDPSVQQMKAAQKMVAEAGEVPNVHFRVLPEGLQAVQEQSSYDVAFVLDGSSVRNEREPEAGLRSLLRALKKGCPLLYMETVAKGMAFEDQNHPAGPLLYTLSAMHCLPIAMDKEDVGDPVGGVWGHGQAKAAMEEAGFIEVETAVLEDDGLHCLLIGRTPKP